VFDSVRLGCVGNANGHLTRHPGARFRTPRLKRTIPILPAFHDLAAQLASKPSLRNRAIALYGGLRAGEIAGLRRAHLRARPGTHRVRGQGPEAASVAPPRQALEIVRHYPASGNGHGPNPEAPLIRKEGGSGEALSYYVINAAAWAAGFARPSLGGKLRKGFPPCQSGVTS